jgi:ABC-type sugar transport system ATPase subunit
MSRKYLLVFLLALCLLFTVSSFVSAQNFTVREGEIVSLIGLVGSGKEAVCRCIAGLEKADTGGIILDGRKLPSGSPGGAVRAGIGHIPIDRRS